MTAQSGEIIKGTAHIEQYLKRYRQSGNEIWSVKGTLMQI